MKTTEFRKLISEEVRKTLNEGTLTSAVKSLSIYDLSGKKIESGGLKGELKVAVEALEKLLIDKFSLDGLNRNANKLAHCVIDIIEAARKQ